MGKGTFFCQVASLIMMTNVLEPPRRQVRQVVEKIAKKPWRYKENLGVLRGLAVRKDQLYNIHHTS
jgi:hypothetical protein